MNARSVGRHSTRNSPWFSTSEFTLRRNLMSVKCVGNPSNGARVSFTIRNCTPGRKPTKLQGHPRRSPAAPPQSCPLCLPSVRDLPRPRQGLRCLVRGHCCFLLLCLSSCCSPHRKWPSLQLSKLCISFRIMLLLGSHLLRA